MKNIFYILVVIFSMISCTDDVEVFDENKAIIGKFQAHSSFSIIDPNADQPAPYDHFLLEDGFTLELTDDGNFILTKYECTTGSYQYDEFSNLLTLNFDCPIEINGESFTTISEDIFGMSDNGFNFSHEFNRPDANTDISSLMLRIK